MKPGFLFIGIVILIFFSRAKLCAQNNQTVSNGALTAPVTFPANGCTYQWVNNNPGIGLPVSGSGNIGPFTAINNGNIPITATITATPVPSSGYAYVANSGSNTVSVISVLTRNIVATIQAGGSATGVWVSPDGTHAYLSNYSPSNIQVINTATNSLTATIPLQQSAFGITVSPDGSKAYASYGHDIAVINTTNNTVTANIFVGDHTDAIVPSPDGSKLYVTDNYSDTISVITTTTNKVISAFVAGMVPAGIVVSPDGTRLYVANSYSNNISVINAANNAIITNIPVGAGPWGEVLSPDGSLLYVTNSGNNGVPGALPPGTVSVINTITDKVITTISVGQYPIGISITPDGSQVYVTNDITDNVSIISTATNSVVADVSVGTNPGAYGSFITGGAPCNGSPVTFTITVNPTSKITASNVTGSISACAGSASATPDIEQFTVLGNNLSGDITATASAGFEISLTAGNGYSSKITLTTSAGAVDSTVIYVRSAASAPTGNISGNVILASAGVNTLNVAVTGTVNAQVIPSVSIAASTSSICAGTAVTFTATPTNGGSSAGYQWRINGNNAGTNNATFTSSTLVNGDVVNCIITSNAACVVPVTATSNSITMAVSSQIVVPSVSIAASANDICAGMTVTFTATVVNSGNAPIYQWQVNNVNAGTNNAAFTSSTLTNDDIVSCIMTSNAACATPASAISNAITMNVTPLPLVNAGGNNVINLGGNVLLNATASGSIADITWNPATGLSNNKILNPIASPVSTTTYTLAIQSTGGCIGIDSAIVEVVFPITVPNTFTPNGDGVNDTWEIKYLNEYKNCTVQVFSRWGQMVFSSIGYGIPWNGTYKGSVLPTGTYYYIIKLKNSNKLLSGYVAIVK